MQLPPTDLRQSVTGPDIAVEPAAINAQLEKIAGTKFFRTSPRLRRFLCFTVECALDNRADLLKEYCIALEVFNKPETFDPRIDSAVRVAARQLRAKIDSYYLTEGAHDPILIRFRPGDYVPKFYLRHGNNAAIEANDEIPSPPAIIVDKEWSTVREVTAALDSIAYPITGILDAGEKALDATASLPSFVMVAGLSLTGRMTGIDLVRAVREAAAGAIVSIAPLDLCGSLLGELVAADPDAVLFKPVRQMDVPSAIRLALVRHGVHGSHAHADALPALENQQKFAMA